MIVELRTSEDNQVLFTYLPLQLTVVLFLQLQVIHVGWLDLYDSLCSVFVDRDNSFYFVCVQQRNALSTLH